MTSAVRGLLPSCSIVKAERIITIVRIILHLLHQALFGGWRLRGFGFRFGRHNFFGVHVIIITIFIFVFILVFGIVVNETLRIIQRIADGLTFPCRPLWSDNFLKIILAAIVTICVRIILITVAAVLLLCRLLWFRRCLWLCWSLWRRRRLPCRFRRWKLKLHILVCVNSHALRLGWLLLAEHIRNAFGGKLTWRRGSRRCLRIGCRRWEQRGECWL
mmetsp:Transcript_70226/g.117187  ORF Transcript_70226/g.117187 Transcript_70226/m.117187 type:complete len:217 (+) Transcript_70226:772-1422(+)